MKKCPRCGRPYNAWKGKCQVCREYFWLLPHKILFVLLGLGVLYLLVMIVEHLATR